MYKIDRTNQTVTVFYPNAYGTMLPYLTVEFNEASEWRAGLLELGWRPPEPYKADALDLS